MSALFNLSDAVLSVPACCAYIFVCVTPVNYMQPSGFSPTGSHQCINVSTHKGFSSHAQGLEFKDIHLAVDGTFTEMLIHVY